jgi:ABC-type enterobactin transport system permease subunit
VPAEVWLVFVIAAIAAAAGVGAGIVLIAPRITRALDRAESDDEEPGDRPA